MNSWRTDTTDFLNFSESKDSTSKKHVMNLLMRNGMEGGGVLTNGSRGPDEALGGPNERHWGSRRTRTTAKTRQNTPGPHQEDQDTLKHP